MSDVLKVISNFDEHKHLGVSIISCRLYDLTTLDTNMFHNYTEPIYTKLDGVYGYISVSGNKVFFFWNNTETNNVSCDDVSEKFKIEYVTENINEL